MSYRVGVLSATLVVILRLVSAEFVKDDHDASLLQDENDAVNIEIFLMG